jgi:endonuclease/exonuclease/phosphatase family metal-dependent hydrolase
MRIVSYNILNGGQGRADPLTEVILAQRADVVVLVEADDPDVVRHIARRLNMDFVHADAGSHAGAILSRWPMKMSINHAATEGHWMNAFVEAHVIDPAGVEWPIVGVHFAAHASLEREQLRERQLHDLFRRLKHLQGKPHILAGDFNANAPSQQIDPARCYPGTQQKWIDNGGLLPRRLVGKLLDAGYVDTLHTIAPDLADVTGTYTTHSPGQRIDYIFTHGIERSRIRSAWIERDRLAQYTSDHFPIGAEIG